MPHAPQGPAGAFVVRDYNFVRPWSSFFPGIAGRYGIPLWVFYVNRGQGIASFGIRSKDEAIMEYLPANRAYQETPLRGFRTFLKVRSSRRTRRTREAPRNFSWYEPFCAYAQATQPRGRHRMLIRAHELEIVDENPELGLRTRVVYFPVVQAPFPGLARVLEIENFSAGTLDLEFLDGMSVIIPYGVNNFFLKEMSRTIEAWMSVGFPSPGVAAFKLTTDPRDSSQVLFVKGAHFYTGFKEGTAAASSRIIVDPAAVFGPFSDFTYPAGFLTRGSSRMSAGQVYGDKTPCAFSLGTARLAPKASVRYFSLAGHVFDVADIGKLRIGAWDADFFEGKRRENQDLIDSIMDGMFTSSALPAFDQYARQTYLDNAMRGGLPQTLCVDGSCRNIYVYSRKHGDLERDYNRFFIAATYFSEGEGNYRDMNQNRRSDLFFCPALAEKNISDFMNLLQLDGYNPLGFKGERWIIAGQALRDSALAKMMHEKELGKIGHLVTKPFVLGDVLQYVQENRVKLACPLEEFVKILLNIAEPTVEAAFGEGYWSDHWTYNTDLLETFRAVYPERMRRLLLEERSFTYYDTPVFVKPRHERYVIQHGEVRQYHALGTDEEKNALIQRRTEERHKVRAANGEGPVLKTTLMDKLVCLIVNKIATLDPSGVGVEMEADKPNWYDALNGLPGLLGSSVSETFELKRLVLLVKGLLEDLKADDAATLSLTAEVADFFRQTKALLEQGLSPYDYWNDAQALKESYRRSVRRGVRGDFKAVAIADLKAFFDAALGKLEAGLAAARAPSEVSYATYFTHRVTRHESRTDAAGRHAVAPLEFRRERLPLFLEGFVHALRTEPDRAKRIHETVRRSPLFDRKLKMYKVNASLKEESYEIGRAKVFTPGWLENESIWLHMEYKYLLELLKNGLFEEFYSDFFNVLVPFQDPAVYGRSIFENSSFIVSSAHPDPSLHGAGFVARLSGSTAEMVHMWLLMNAGPRPFFLDGAGSLCLRLRPALAAKLFAQARRTVAFFEASGKRRREDVAKDAYAFLFLGKTLVIYRNPKRKNTFGSKGVRPVRISVFEAGACVREIQGDTLMPPYAERVRNGSIDRLDVLLGN